MNSQKYNPFLNIPSAIILAGALIAVAIIWTLKPAPATSHNALGQGAYQPPAVSVSPIVASDHILGDPNAPVKIVVYSDPSCPYCKIFFPTMRQIMKDYGATGQVAWIYRSFPLSNIHANAMHESQALECANKIGGSTAFWAMANKLYDETPAVTPQTPQGLDQSKLAGFAQTVGVDVTKFNACLSSGETKTAVDAQYAKGIRDGVNGTPSSFILTKDGQTIAISGAQPLATVKQTIDAILSTVK